MSELTILLTDYQRDEERIKRKCQLVRKAFPNSEIIMGLNASDHFIDKMAMSCMDHGISIDRSTIIPKGLANYATKIETGYLYYISLLRRFSESLSKYSLVVESDLYPIREDTETRVIEYFRDKEFGMMGHVISQNLDIFLRYDDLKILWDQWLTMLNPIQVPGYLIGFSTAGAKAIVEEFDSVISKSFQSKLESHIDSPAAKWLIETAFPFIMRKHGLGILETIHEPVTCFNNKDFSSEMGKPEVSFVHGVRDDHKGYPGGTKDVKTIHNIWRV